MRIVVVGGGAAGFSAAMVAKRVGADEVVVIERTDMLGGLGLVAGLGLCGSGAFATLAEEKALGGASLFYDVFYPIATRKELTTPGFDKAMLYNTTKLDARMQKVLKENGIRVMLSRRVSDIRMVGRSIEAVTFADGTEIDGDVFIDATGSATGIKGCTEFGYGCVECILRCPTFGNPQGLVDKKVTPLSELNSYGKPGVLGTSLLLPIASLSEECQEEIKEKGYALVSVPPGIEADMDRARRAATYGGTGAGRGVMAQDVLTQNLLLLDVGGHVKVTAQGSPRYASSLRSIPGLEESYIAQPAAGAKGHLVFGLAMVPRKNSLEVEGFENVLCAGIKAGQALFLMDVACTGDLAGYNAVRKGQGQNCLELPKTLGIGAFIDYVGQLMRTEEGLRIPAQTSTNTLKSLGVYRETEEEIVKEVEKVGLKGIYGSSTISFASCSTSYR